MKTWPTVALGDVASIDRSTVHARDIKAGMTYVGLEHIDSAGELDGSVRVNGGMLASSKFVFSEQHVLYGKLRPYLAKVARPNFAGVCSTDILPIRSGPRLERAFLFHYLRQPHIVERATSLAVGVNLPRLNPSALVAFEIPLPPIDEQRRIAEVLDRADALRAKRQAAIAMLNDLPRAIYLEMFGDPVRNDRSWPQVKLGTIGNVDRGVSKHRP